MALPGPRAEIKAISAPNKGVVAQPPEPTQVQTANPVSWWIQVGEQLPE